MTAERVKELEVEVEKLQQEQDALYKRHANEKAQMQLAIEHEKLQNAELAQSNAAFQEENDQWRAGYDALQAAKTESEERLENEKRQLEENLSMLQETVKSYGNELVSDLEEIEKEKVALAAQEQSIAELQQQLDEGNNRFEQLTSEYDALNTAFEQLAVEKNDGAQQYAAFESQQQSMIAQHQATIAQQEAVIADLNQQVAAKSLDEEVRDVNQHALLQKAEQELADKVLEVAEQEKRIKQLEEELSLLSLTGGGSNVTALRDLQQQVFEKSNELVQQAEKHLQLGASCDKLKTQLHELTQEVNQVRGVLLKGIIGDGVDEAAYKHVKLDELVRLRLKSQEHELRLLNATSSSQSSKEEEDQSGNSEIDSVSLVSQERAPTHLANVESFSAVESFGTVGRLERELRLARVRNKRLQERVERLEDELTQATTSLSEFQALKERAVELVGRERVEKELRTKAEASCQEATEKIVALSEHIEKLMIHLKHEAAGKTKAVDLQRRTDKELTECKDKLSSMTKKSLLKDQQLQELEQGAKILEDQLRLMDEKFIEVRNKLDWTRATSQREVKKLQGELTTLRMKWQLASDSGVLASLPDWAIVPKLAKKNKDPLLSPSHSDSRLPSTTRSNNAPSGSLSPPSANPSRNGSDRLAGDALSKKTRFDIPKLPQADSEIGTPWSDAKLSVLQRQLQDKRKL